MRRNSWFSKSKIGIINILTLTFFWVHELPTKYIEQELRVSSQTVHDWACSCREICIEMLLKDNRMIGGEEVTVEIDEVEINRNLNRGKPDERV